MQTSGVFDLSVRGVHTVTRAWDERARAAVDRSADQPPCSVLEYLAGHNLDEVLATWGALPVATAVDWILQAAEALAEAHAQGIPHGGLTPPALIVIRGANGRPVVHLAERDVSQPSSARYMAPEQLTSPPGWGVTTDIWALGAILHEMLSAQPAFRGGTLFEVCAAVHMQSPPPLSRLRYDVEPGLEAVVQRCLDKNPAARFANVREMAWSVATFGTVDARSSCDRIQRTFQSVKALAALHEAVVEETSVREEPLESAPFDGATDEELQDPWPHDLASERIAFGSPASPKVVFAGLGMLILLAMTLLAWMYVAVHGIDLGSLIEYR
jgi:serine/threonine protein kinase